MTTLKSRLAKLESTITPPRPVFHVGRFIVSPENPTPMGYVCDGIMAIRKNGEAKEAFHRRCLEAVTCPNKSSRHIFEPLEGACH